MAAFESQDTLLRLDTVFLSSLKQIFQGSASAAYETPSELCGHRRVQKGGTGSAASTVHRTLLNNHQSPSFQYPAFALLHQIDGIIGEFFCSVYGGASPSRQLLISSSCVHFQPAVLDAATRWRHRELQPLVNENNNAVSVKRTVKHSFIFCVQVQLV